MKVSVLEIEVISSRKQGDQKVSLAMGLDKNGFVEFWLETNGDHIPLHNKTEAEYKTAIEALKCKPQKLYDAILKEMIDWGTYDETWLKFANIHGDCVHSDKFERNKLKRWKKEHNDQIR